MLLFNFLHHYQPQSVLWQIQEIKIYWYGLLMAISVLASYGVILGLAKKLKSDIRYSILLQRQNLVLALIIFGFIGARIYHILSEGAYYLQNPLAAFKIWQGGLGIYGAVIAGALVIFIYVRKYKLSFLFLADLIVPGLILAQAIGRWGNYFNNELFGLPTTLPWGIPIPALARPLEFLSEPYFHPTFLYESLGNLLIFVILILVFKQIYLNSEMKNKRTGIILGLYLILYSLLRLMVEFLRIDSQPLLLDLRLAQIMAILFFILGWIIIFKKSFLKIKNQRSNL